jgi:hypothetical protein
MTDFLKGVEECGTVSLTRLLNGAVLTTRIGSKGEEIER